MYSFLNRTSSYAYSQRFVLNIGQNSLIPFRSVSSVENDFDKIGVPFSSGGGSYFRIPGYRERLSYILASSWSFNALHRHHFRFFIPYSSVVSILPSVIDDNGDGDNTVYLITSRRRRRIATLARDCGSEESLQRCHRKHTVTNISLPFFLCAA